MSGFHNTTRTENVYQLASDFLAAFTVELSHHSIKLADHWNIDHICYRTFSYENYAHIREVFSELGSLLGESQVNGRPIATFKLDIPIEYEQKKSIWSKSQHLNQGV